MKNRLLPFFEQEKNIGLVKECVRNIGFELCGFKSFSVLQLYFDIFEDGQDKGYISKAWNDPGFRVGEIITLSKGLPDFKNKFYRIFNICSQNLISLGIMPEESKDLLTLSLEIGIYNDGFNENTLRGALESLSESIDEIQQLLSNDYLS